MLAGFHYFINIHAMNVSRDLLPFLEQLSMNMHSDYVQLHTTQGE